MIEAKAPASTALSDTLARGRLPAVRYDADGKRVVDYGAVVSLAGPLFLNSAMQAVLSLTDTWFIGRISIEATAAMGASFFMVIAVTLLCGGVGLAVQTVAAQSFGAGRDAQAAQAAWTGLWATLPLLPVLVAFSLAGDAIFAPFALSPDVARLAEAYWFPRILGTPFVIGLWAFTGFFNGIGRTRTTLLIALAAALVNAATNDLFIFRLGGGIAGSAWATTASLAFANLVAAFLFLRRPIRERFASHRAWRPDLRAIGSLYALGIPMGVFAAVDLIGFSFFQLMQVKLGPVSGAATQIVMMLTSTAFYPALGLAIAATTLVGQSIGAGDKAWAYTVGNAAISLAVGYMGIVGILLALGGRTFISQFIAADAHDAEAVIRIGAFLLWIAAGYQIFDALNMGAGFCLRGAGDVRVPTFMLIGLSWCGFVPVAHMLTFAPGEGYVDFLPQFGLGVEGGWIAALVYIACLGLMLFTRWRSGAWRRLAPR